jgi:hypothetical protein
MSNRLAAFLVVGALTSFDALSIAGAQQRSTPQDSLLRTIRRLDSLMIAQSQAVDSARRSLVRPVPPIELVRGAVHVRTDAALAPRVRLAVDSVAALVDRRGGAVMRERIAGRVLMVAPDSVRSILSTRRVVTLSADTARRWSVARIQAAGNPSAARLTAGLTTLVEQIAIQGADSAFAAWLMVGRVPIGPASDGDATDGYIELATSESAAVRRCRSRELASCLDVLGLDSLPGRRLERWYAPEDYRSLLRAVAPPREDSAAVAAWLRCRDDRDQPACRTAAVALPDDRVPLPLSASARLAFLRVVLDAGGRGAYDRLLGTSGTLRLRFAVAGGEPTEASVARWLARTEGARPDRMSPPLRLIVASLGWSGAILALALIRRTSWA